MKLLLIACSVFLILGLTELPIGYYTFLRIIVTIGAVAVIVKEYKEDLNIWVVLFRINCNFF